MRGNSSTGSEYAGVSSQGQGQGQGHGRGQDQGQGQGQDHGLHQSQLRQRPPYTVQDVAEACMQPDPSVRPTFSKLVAELTALLAAANAGTLQVMNTVCSRALRGR